jgi:hypothetical protein
MRLSPKCKAVIVYFTLQAKGYYSDGKRVAGSQFVKISNVVNIFGIAMAIIAFISIVIIIATSYDN